MSSTPFTSRESTPPRGPALSRRVTQPIPIPQPRGTYQRARAQPVSISQPQDTQPSPRTQPRPIPQSRDTHPRVWTQPIPTSQPQGTHPRARTLPLPISQPRNTQPGPRTLPIPTLTQLWGTPPEPTRRRVQTTSLPTSPAGPHAALYLTVTESADDGDIEVRQGRALLRNCSFVLQPDPALQTFCAYYHHGSHNSRTTLYHVKDLPDPRKGEPGLMAMNFIAWIPRKRVSDLNVVIKTINIGIWNTWNSGSWAQVCLQKMVDARLISQRQMEWATYKQRKALNSDFRENYPNYWE
jgi:hypothetical protein